MEMLLVGGEDMHGPAFLNSTGMCSQVKLACLVWDSSSPGSWRTQVSGQSPFSSVRAESLM